MKEKTIGVQVHYPAGTSELRLRSDHDWERDWLPLSSSADGTRFEFELPLKAPYHYAKPVLHQQGLLRWAQGHNALLLANRWPRVLHPHFDAEQACHLCTLHEPPVDADKQGYAVRVYVPDGYDENTLARYPVLYMQDGPNLFRPEEAFAGESWRVGETMQLLREMNLTRPTIVVGIYPRERMLDYTEARRQAYLDFCVEKLKPWVDEHYRSLRGPQHTGVMGSSLGGVISLYSAWARPDIFGKVACLSSTFGYESGLFREIERGPKRSLEIYLDSGWPGDNYEVTRSMSSLLIAKGWRAGRDLHYFAFPEALHNEKHWAMRAHLPFQILFGEGQGQFSSGPLAQSTLT